jgi:hypothetical protein
MCNHLVAIETEEAPVSAELAQRDWFWRGGNR